MPMRLLWILVLALACGPALALGLGQIEVKSRHGQPLLAEIPIVSSDPSELEQLQARLASPDTFRRIGLEPPRGLVSDLRFSIALDPQGRPVIRITSDAPVQESVLTFLVEVDWGQGRLVREYSALVDSPQTVAAPVQPPVDAPLAGPSNAIVREAEAAPPSPVGDGPAEVAAADPVDAPAEPAPAPVATPARPPAVPAAAVAAAGALPPVQAGQTLSGIAAGLSAQTGLSLNQTMVALLRANPEAFIRGNINLLREGAVLRIPGAQELSDEDVRAANAIVREQVAQWREWRNPVPQPVEAVAAADAGAAAAARRTSDARLEIVPPTSGGAAQAGTRSGISAGGEGDMLRQQELTEARETIAARSAEVDELKARVAELEQLQQQQAQLIALKDSELAAAQQRLAESNQQPAPTLASTTQPAAAEASATPLPWTWIGLGVFALALLAWWWASRRSAASARATRSFLADQPVATRSSAMAASLGVPASTAPVADDPAPAAPAPAPARLDPAAAMAASGWPNTTPATPAAEPESPRADVAAPPWHAPGDGATIAPLNPAPAGQERLELARAYIDLGDVDTARTLLQEVADTGDMASRGEAARLLRELV
jgi:pilus assembly protein FimV